MSSRQPQTLLHLLRGSLASLLLGVNTLVFSVPLLAFAILKLLLPIPFLQQLLYRLVHLCANAWIRVNGLWMAGIDWQVTGLEGLDMRHSWLVTSNHQSWADIFALQNRFIDRIPFLKFFLKQELIWVPVIGLCWWALEFPFMKRHSRKYLAKHPERRGQDMETTRKACQRYRRNPVSVFNFAEGTRFTTDKHRRQNSPYQHLLKPKAGGIAFVLDAMGDQIAGLVDVTIHYPAGRPTYWMLASGQVRQIVVHVDTVAIPAEFMGRNYEEDANYRISFQRWMNARWQAKDARLADLKKAYPS